MFKKCRSRSPPPPLNDPPPPPPPDPLHCEYAHSCRVEVFLYHSVMHGNQARPTFTFNCRTKISASYEHIKGSTERCLSGQSTKHAFSSSYIQLRRRNRINDNWFSEPVNRACCRTREQVNKRRQINRFNTLTAPACEIYGLKSAPPPPPPPPPSHTHTHTHTHLQTVYFPVL